MVSFFFFVAAVGPAPTDGTALPARSAPFLPGPPVVAGGGMDPRSDVGRVDGWRAAAAVAGDTAGAATPATGGETWGSLAELF